MEPGDADSVARLLSESLAPRLHPFLAYCQPGLKNYLRVLLEHPRSYPRRHLYVAFAGEGLPVGFAEWQSTSSACHLSYICVAVAARRIGLARRLLAFHLDREPRESQVELNVFAHNEPALLLYERLGFARISEATWWTREIPRLSGFGEVILREWHTSAASLDRYGFCQVAAELGGREHRLGLTSRSVLKVNSRDDFTNDHLIGGIGIQLPEVERVLMIAPSGSQPPGMGRETLRAYRMIAGADLLRANL